MKKMRLFLVILLMSFCVLTHHAQAEEGVSPAETFDGEGHCMVTLGYSWPQYGEAPYHYSSSRVRDQSLSRFFRSLSDIFMRMSKTHHFGEHWENFPFVCGIDHEGDPVQTSGLFLGTCPQARAFTEEMISLYRGGLDDIETSRAPEIEISTWEWTTNDRRYFHNEDDSLICLSAEGKMTGYSLPHIPE